MRADFFCLDMWKLWTSVIYNDGTTFVTTFILQMFYSNGIDSFGVTKKQSQ